MQPSCGMKAPRVVWYESSLLGYQSTTILGQYQIDMFFFYVLPRPAHRPIIVVLLCTDRGEKHIPHDLAISSALFMLVFYGINHAVSIRKEEGHQGMAVGNKHQDDLKHEEKTEKSHSLVSCMAIIVETQ